MKVHKLSLSARKLKSHTRVQSRCISVIKSNTLFHIGWNTLTVTGTDRERFRRRSCFRAIEDERIVCMKSLTKITFRRISKHHFK